MSRHGLKCIFCLAFLVSIFTSYCAAQDETAQVPSNTTVSLYFADHATNPVAAKNEHATLDYHAAQFKRQLATGIPFAFGSDVGPFPHGTQARELMVKFGLMPAQALQADMLEGAIVPM